MVGMATSCVVLFTVFAVTGNLSTQTDRDITRIPINSAGRAAVEDVLYYLRGARVIDVASTATKIIASAPSYDPNAAGVTTGTSDTMTFEFDSTNQILWETITTSGGTVRKAIGRHSLAKNVQNAVFTYYGLQTFPLASFSNSTPSNQTFTLNNAWKTGTTPSVSLVVNGTSYTLPSATMPVSVDAAAGTVTVGNVPGGIGAVEIRYELTSGSSALSSVAQVNVKLRFLKKDSRQVDQTFTIAGSARLRNLLPS